MQGKAYKFAKFIPYYAYGHVAIIYNGVELKNINKPRSKHIKIALNRMERCPKEI